MKPSESTFADSEAKYRALVELSPDAIFIHQDDHVVFVNTALHESQQQLTLALQATQTGVFTVDYATRTLFWSPEVQRMFGVDRFDGREDTFWRMVHPDDVARLRQEFDATLDGDQLLQTEFRIVRPDGTVRWVLNHGRAADDEARPSRRFLGIVQDITERKEAEARLLASCDTFRQLVENSPFGVYVVDADFRLAQVSAGAQKVFTHVRPLLGRDFAEVIRLIWPEPFASGVIAIFRQTLATGEPYHAPCTVERRGDIDEVEAYDWKIERLTLPDGRAGVVCHFYDLSERQQHEAELRKSEEKLRLLVENAPAAMALFDREMRYLAVSRRWVTDYELRGDLLGRSHYAVFPEIPDRWKAIYQRGLAGEVVKSEEDHFERANGAVQILTRWEVHPWYDAEGAVGGIVIFTEDITERRRRERNAALLATLTADLNALADEHEIMQLAAERTGEYLNVSRCSLLEFDLPRDEARLIYDWHSAGHASHVGVYRMAEFLDAEEVAALSAGHQFVVEDTANETRTAARIATMGRLDIGALVDSPYLSGGRWQASLVVTSRAPRAWRADELELLRELSSRIWLRIERARAESAWRAADERLRTMTDNVPVLIWEADASGVTFTNQHYLDFFGVGFAAIREMGWAELAHPDDVAAYVAAYQTAFAHREVYQRECRFRRADGEYRWLLNTGRPLGADRFIGFSADITEQKYREANLQFLADLQTEIGHLSTPAEIQRTACQRIADHLGLAHCLFVEIDEAAAQATVVQDCHAPPASSRLGVYDLAEFHTAEERATMRANRQVIRHDIAAECAPDAAQRFAALGIGALLMTPYASHGRWAFALSAQHDRPYRWRDDERELLQELAARIYLRLERARAEAALQQRRAQLGLLARTAQLLIFRQHDEAELLQAVCDEVARAIGAEMYFNYQPHDDESMRLSAWGGLTDDERTRFATIRYGELLCGRVAVRRQPLIIEDLRHTDIAGSEAVRAAGYGAYAGFPLVAGDQLLGTIAFITRTKTHFAGGEVRMMNTVCDQVSATLDRLRLTRELHASEERLRLASEAAEFGVYERSFDPDRLVWSPILKRIFGLPPDAPVSPGEPLRHLHPDDYERVVARITAGFDPAGTGEFEDEHRIIRADGAVRWIRVRGRTEFSNQQPRRAFGSLVDITARKQLELEREQLLVREQQARQLAEEANRAKDDWLAMVTHELRSPLNAMLGHARLHHLRRAQLSPDFAAFADLIKRNGERQNELINDLLDTARMATGKLQLDLGPVRLTDVIVEALDTVRPSAQARNVMLLPKLDAAAGLITGDAARLQQVVWNLLTNAVKFTPADGCVIVRLHRTPEQIILTISDTGQGIAPEFLPHVFERFSQADTSRGRRHGGLGLGLALVKHIVELHGGTITAASEGMGCGATFTVNLPARGNVREGREARPNLVVNSSRETKPPLTPLKGKAGN